MVTSTEKRKIKVKEDIVAEIEIPEKITIKFENNILAISGPKGNIKKNFEKMPVTLTIDSNKTIIKPFGKRKKDLAITNTIKSVIRNMITISVKISDKQISIENFIGERAPRVANIVGDCKVSVEGEDLIIKGPSLEDVSQTAANVEIGTKIRDKDARVFLDGLYVYSKEKGI